MERSSDLHGPRLDDALAKETASLTHGAPIEARVEDERLVEDAGDDEPVPESLIGQSDEIRNRSELARHLRPSIFPARPEELATCVLEEGASEDMASALRALPDIEYLTTNEVWVALGGHEEARESAEPQPERVNLPQRFLFRFERPYRIAALPLGVTSQTAYVEVDRDGLRVAFGPWRLRTSIDNISGLSRTDGYAVLKTIGPPHLSLADRGVTFATSRGPGLCICFVRPVRGIEPFGVLRHPSVTVTVDDVDGLRETLGQLGGG